MKIQSLVNSHPLQLDRRQSKDYSNLQKYPCINSDPPERKDAEIYGIYKAVNGRAVGKFFYVGHTTGKRAIDRFVEQANYDMDCPWYIRKCGGYDQHDQNKWPYDTFQFENLKDATKFEVTCAEQFWIEN